MQELAFYGADDDRIEVNKELGAAETEYSPTYGADMAFNEQSHADLNYYCSQKDVSSGWLSYSFEAPTVLTKYAIENLPYNNEHAPVAWSFQGSMDGLTWDVLDTRSAYHWYLGDLNEFILIERGNH